MTCCSTKISKMNCGGKEKGAVSRRLPSTDPSDHENASNHESPKSDHKIMVCPSCGLNINCQEKSGIINDLPGLPAGVKFDPSDQEILDHLEAKVRSDGHKLHPLIHEFIQTLEGENGICYTHPEKLPGVSTDGLVRHFFHRPSKAYTTGTRKRRKVHTDIDGCETRWHKTGKTRPVAVKGKVKGYKKILVLYINYGRQRKPEKTNWVMHQYHLGNNEDEKDGELVVSKVFYQTQPRQCGSFTKDSPLNKPNGSRINNGGHEGSHLSNSAFSEYYNSGIISFDQCENDVSTLHLNYSNFNIFKSKVISEKQVHNFDIIFQENYVPFYFFSLIFLSFLGVAGSWCRWRN